MSWADLKLRESEYFFTEDETNKSKYSKEHSQKVTA